MSTKAKKVVDQTAPVEKPGNKYPKERLIKADRWKDRKDLLNALLDDGKVYTIDEVDRKINDYFNKEV